MDDEAQKLYRDSDSNVRSSFDGDAEKAQQFYQSLISFVLQIAPPVAGEGTKLLDVGCGSGWSTYFFAKEGYNATGIDLNPVAFEPPPDGICTLCFGSATDIPYPPQSFDVIVSYQCLEHVPDPAKALDEMVRICRPGGTIAIVGPNLLSPTAGLMYALQPASYRWIKFRRRPGMAVHPYGNTLLEILLISFRRSWELLLAVSTPRPRFLMRQPDLTPPFHGDNDACYLCNPTDLIKYFHGRGLRILRRGRPGRPPLSYLFAGGTWVASRKGNDPTTAKP